MSKLNVEQLIGQQYDRARLVDVVRAITGTINSLVDGRIDVLNASASVPSGTAVSYAKGDFVPDSNCSVRSSVSPGVPASYVRLGWVCTVAGSPGTFEEVRVLTGSGSSFSASQITSSLGSDVALNNTANYFTGPSVAQGTTGTWFVSGTVVVVDTAGGANFNVKLWDGTTVIASARFTTTSAAAVPVSLSGFIAAPAADLRISVQDATATTGAIKFNASGNSKDSTITAFRIA